MRLPRLPLLALGALWLAAAANADPALWRLDRADGARLYLFGTVHALKSAEWDRSDLQAVLEDVEAVYVELDLTDPATLGRFQRLMQRQATGGEGLAALDDPELLAGLERLATEVGLPFGQLRPFEPWFVGVNLTFALTTRAGGKPELGVDNAVLALAVEDGLPIEELDTPEVQINALASGDLDVQRRLLGDLVENADDVAAMVDAWDAAWRRGDLDGLAPALAEGFDGMPQALRRAVLDERDARWVSTLDAVAADGPYLVAVGAAHVVLEGGLLDRFEDKGWTVTRIDDLN